MTTPAPRHSVPSDVAATGVIVALGLPKEVASALAVPGGVPAEDLHVTLAYLGTTVQLGDSRLEAVRESVAKLAEHTPALAGRVTGIGRFSREDGLDVAYISVDAPELPAFREALLCELAEGAGLETDSRYGFTPHVTLAFVGADEDHPYDRVEPLSFAFDTLEVWAGPRRDAFSLRLGDGAPTACETTQAAEDTAGSVSLGALQAVVSDWLPSFVSVLSAERGRQRVKRVAEGLDDLHTRLLAAHLASPARAASGASPEAALLARASRVRSVETDLGLILGTAARDLQQALTDVTEDALGRHVRDALKPLLAWAAVADERDGD
ncbi:2'-5' RNA ligase family protein [Deinococcus yavapaiensis]|uniref:2'-5' RNA ligase n=1 Tax=Deinococcus yavapaiensis KR-236 TaxID=694435 RepID=A0A318SEV6_9DEIO|nr:2'-5' RNA ligase family protein [Deinococcus yavapaiensis]PYE55765.1 2'-5' RNA ligase [Deinococcus yavapaiensis KR-236]